MFLSICLCVSAYLQTKPCDQTIGERNGGVGGAEELQDYCRLCLFTFLDIPIDYAHV